MISVIIPTYNEAPVIEETLRRSAAALRATGDDFELIVVDDASADGTAERVEALAGEIPVRVLRRPGRLGLATAVLDGWGTANGDVLGVLDADLQHPPETLTGLVDAIHQGADLAIGSRYVPGGGIRDWPLRRRVTSLVAIALAKPLTSVNDITSGYFLVKREALDGVELDPIGFKIGLEVIAKAHYGRALEVPYVFQDRAVGQSKLNGGEITNYLRQLGRIYALRLKIKPPGGAADSAAGKKMA